MKTPIYYYVDHTCRFAHNSGIQRCVRALAGALLDTGQPLIPVVWDRDHEQLAPATTAALSHLARWSGPPAQAWSPWRPATDLNTDGWLLIVELVSGPHNPSHQQLRQAAETMGIKLAWLFHDAIPVRWAQLYGTAAGQAASCHSAYMKGLAWADLVFCNSHTSHAHLLEFLKGQDLAVRKGQIVPLPLAEEFGGDARPSSPPQKLNQETLELLCVSTLETRKNHRGLLKALALLHSQGIRNWQLQLVGWAADQAVLGQIQRAATCGLPVRWHGRANDETLAALYNRCDFTVYPSLEEGFGLPVAESLWQRRPCLCSGEGALGERAADGGCLTVNTRDWRSIANGLQHLLTEPMLRQTLSAEASKRKFRRWADVAHELMTQLRGN